MWRMAAAAAAVLFLCGGGGGGGDGVNAAQCKLTEPPAPEFKMASLFPVAPFLDTFSNIWAPDHQALSADHLQVSLALDKSSGTGFKTKKAYVHGFFNAAIKLPANEYTAGVVNTFYASNQELFPSHHDEIDFEFLGRVPGEYHIIQTNLYMNGSTNTGREQRLRLWFDPTLDFHDYSILWTSENIILYIDDVPIREFPSTGSQYPSKPMHVYATIWDGSDWATDGGRHKVNYSYAPFVAKYANLIVNGCASRRLHGPSARATIDCAHEFTHIVHPRMTHHQQKTMKWIQQTYLTYNYCEDKQRYPNSLPECLEPSKKHCGF